MGFRMALWRMRSIYYPIIIAAPALERPKQAFLKSLEWVPIA